MKKNLPEHSFIKNKEWLKILPTMKNSLLIFLITVIHASASVLVHSQNLTFTAENKTVREVLRQIENETNYRFFYNEEFSDLSKTVSFEANNCQINDVMDLMLSSSNITYRLLENDLVVITPYATHQNQENVVSGTVTDNLGKPLPGVTVVVQGTTIGTATDINGKFTLSIPDDAAILEFSYVGMQTLRQAIGDQTTFNVTLLEDAIGLDEVLVVSYGTQIRREITGAITQISADELSDMPVGQFAQRIQGKAAGMQINQQTGRPGLGMAFRIRGSASLNAGNVPLFVVDGQPLEDYGGINNINPDEIESFTVLKDASATALYGSRATNGVILITTKSAKPGESRLDVNSYYALAQLDNSLRPPMANARELATYQKAYFEDKILYENWINPHTGLAEVPEVYQNPEKYGKGTDWLAHTTRLAPTQNISVSFSDHRENSSTILTAGYFNQQGIVYNTGYERYSLRVNNTFRLGDRLSVAFNVAPTFSLDNNSAGIDSDGQRRVIEGSLLASPIESPYNEDGSDNIRSSSDNMLAMPNFKLKSENTKDHQKSTRLLSNLVLDFKLAEGLMFKTRADIDMAGQTRDYFLNTIAASQFNRLPPRPASEIRGIYSTSNYYMWLNENILTYQTTFLDEHRIEALAGYTIQKRTGYSSSINGQDFPNDVIEYLNAARTITGTSSKNDWSLLSAIGRLNYSYKGKYLLSGTIRRDGSSRFGFDRKYGVFPSVSAGWIISDESFMDVLPVVSYLKIRASWGLTGNNNLGNYPSQGLIGSSNYVFDNSLVSGKVISQLGNSLLSWEKNEQFDIGADIGLLRDRITLTYDYYHKLTDGLLYQINIPRASGFTSVSSNIGTFEFWGHEFTINSRNLVGTFKWTSNVNISFNRNEVKKLGTEDLPIMGNEFNQPGIIAVGQPIGMFYGYVDDGVYMTQAEFDSQPKHSTSMVGTTRFKDLNGDDVIDIDDRTYIGDPNPNFIFGFTNDFRYKNFDMNMVFSGSYGNDISDGLAESSMNLDGAFNIYSWISGNQWRSEANPGNGKVPRTRQGTTTLYRRISSDKIYDGSYLTLKNISLGYTFPLRNTRYISNLRAYFSIQQAFVLTKYHGNPETGRGGVELSVRNLGHDFTTYPVPRTFSLGINMSL